MARAKKTETITPMIHVGYMIEEILMKKADYKGKWWVVWYNHETMASAGMEPFSSFDEASAWNEANPPQKIKAGDFNRSTIIFAGY